MDLFQQFKSNELSNYAAQSIKGGHGLIPLGDEWHCYGQHHNYNASDSDDAIEWCRNPNNACIYCEPVSQ